MQAADIILKKFELFLFISINIEYKKNAFFIYMPLQAYINNDTNIIINLDIVFANKHLLLQDDIEINQILLEKTGFTCN